MYRLAIICLATVFCVNAAEATWSIALRTPECQAKLDSCLATHGNACQERCECRVNNIECRSEWLAWDPSAAALPEAHCSKWCAFLKGLEGKRHKRAAMVKRCECGGCGCGG